MPTNQGAERLLVVVAEDVLEQVAVADGGRRDAHGPVEVVQQRGRQLRVHGVPLVGIPTHRDDEQERGTPFSRVFPCRLAEGRLTFIITSPSNIHRERMK
jgi:hypothetical protein